MENKSPFSGAAEKLKEKIQDVKDNAMMEAMAKYLTGDEGLSDQAGLMRQRMAQLQKEIQASIDKFKRDTNGCPEVIIHSAEGFMGNWITVTVPSVNFIEQPHTLKEGITT